MTVERRFREAESSLKGGEVWVFFQFSKSFFGYLMETEKNISRICICVYTNVCLPLWALTHHDSTETTHLQRSRYYENKRKDQSVENEMDVTVSKVSL